MSIYESPVGSEFGEFEEVEFGEVGGEYEIFGESDGEFEMLGEGSPLTESEEIELASELLEITSEQELEQFLGNVFKKVARGVGTFVKSPVGRALGGVLKNVAKKALPVVGGALGSMVAPGIGTAIGSKLGSLAGGLFEVELEGMSPENAEYEVARRYVGLAAASARNAAMARPRPGTNPVTVARASVARAARTHAPGLHRQMRRAMGGRAGAGRPGMARPAGAAAGAPRPGAPTPPGAPRPMPPRPGFPPRPGYYPVPGGVAFPDIEPTGVPSGIPDDAFEPVEPSMDGMALSGRWVRRGRKIVVIGA
jgi:uncharacterized protein (DUF697 family)